MLYRTIIGKKIGYKKRHEDGIHPQEDWNLWDKMMEMGASISSIEEGLLYYRRHRENYLKYGLQNQLEDKALQIQDSQRQKHKSEIS